MAYRRRAVQRRQPLADVPNLIGTYEKYPQYRTLQGGLPSEVGAHPGPQPIAPNYQPFPFWDMPLFHSPYWRGFHGYPSFDFAMLAFPDFEWMPWNGPPPPGMGGGTFTPGTGGVPGPDGGDQGGIPFWDGANPGIIPIGAPGDILTTDTPTSGGDGSVPPNPDDNIWLSIGTMSGSLDPGETGSKITVNDPADSNNQKHFGQQCIIEFAWQEDASPAAPTTVNLTETVLFSEVTVPFETHFLAVAQDVDVTLHYRCSLWTVTDPNAVAEFTGGPTSLWRAKYQIKLAGTEVAEDFNGVLGPASTPSSITLDASHSLTATSTPATAEGEGNTAWFLKGVIQSDDPEPHPHPIADITFNGVTTERETISPLYLGGAVDLFQPSDGSWKVIGPISGATVIDGEWDYTGFVANFPTGYERSYGLGLVSVRLVLEP